MPHPDPGVVPIDEWLELRAQTPDEFDSSTMERTLRQSWEIGWDETYTGEDAAIISLRASCERCGHSLKFEEWPKLRPVR